MRPGVAVWLLHAQAHQSVNPKYRTVITSAWFSPQLFIGKA
jgi:hypothetical protein